MQRSLGSHWLNGRAHIGLLLLIGALPLALLVFTQLMPSPLARHMLQHVVAMNVAAPAAAWYLAARQGRRSASAAQLMSVTIIQLLLLWGWHLPAVFSLAHESIALTSVMHVSLFAAALAFWLSIFRAAKAQPFGTVAALLVTGKLYCLYGVLLIFAPRQLFGDAVHAAHTGHVITAPDQQLAGLIMVTACPLTYVGAAVAVVVFWMKTLDAVPAAGRP